MELYSYFRSSAAYRVRIVLNLKELPHLIIPINLLQGEQRSATYKRLNPQGLVPTIKTEHGHVITQSPAIIEWLEEAYPAKALLPQDPLQRATIRSWCFQIACDIHPICNLRVLNYITQTLNVGESGKLDWLHHWIKEGFDTLEGQLSNGPYCAGDKVTLADTYLIPQVFNALRFNVSMSRYPRIMSIYTGCNQLPAFEKAKPNHHPQN